MSRIAYILTTYPSASETFIRNEIALLKEKGLKILIFAVGSDSREERLPDVDVIYRPNLVSIRAILTSFCFPFKDPAAFVRMFSAILQFLLIHPAEALSLVKNIPAICCYSLYLKQLKVSHIHGAFINWPGRIGCILAKMTGIPYSLAVHARDGYVEGGAMELKVKQAVFVLCCSQAMTDYVRSNVTTDECHKIHTVYHGVSIKPENQNPQVLGQTPVIAAIGRFVKKKGFDGLLRAFRDVLSSLNNDAILVLIGDGPEYIHLKNQTRDYKIQKQVHFTGWLNHEQTLSQLSKSYLLAVPSVIASDNDCDGIPNVIPEAFMLNVPVVASGIKSIREVIEDGVNGLICEPGNHQQLKEKMLQLLRDRSLRDAIAERASLYGRSYFNATRNIEKIYSLLCAVGS